MTYHLLIDTSKPESYVVLTRENEILSKRQWKSDRTLSSKLLSAIDELLAEQDIALSQITQYGVQTGPGHYSALRTGIVAASMLAYAASKDLVEIKSGKLEEQIEEMSINKPVDNAVPVYELR